jgi:hypothetical protein
MANSYWQGPPDEESRQHYATVRVQHFQRYHRDAAFTDVLAAFRYFGMCYDQGYRLRDDSEVAA